MDDRLKKVVEAVRAMDDADSLTQVLDALVASAGAEASRAGVLLVRAGRVRVWRDETTDWPLAETGIVADAVRSRRATSTTVVDDASPPVADAPAGATLRAFPIALSSDVVAVLHAEGGDAATLEILARHAARVLEALTLGKAARGIAGVSSRAAAPMADAPADGDGDASLLMDVSAA